MKHFNPHPRIDDSIDALSGSCWFSTLDLASGYWQVELEEKDRPKTAFTTESGLYQFTAMPFLLCRLKEQSEERPLWETVSTESPTFKCYWAQWSMLAVRDGVLFRKWESERGDEITWKLV